MRTCPGVFPRKTSKPPLQLYIVMPPCPRSSYACFRTTYAGGYAGVYGSCGSGSACITCMGSHCRVTCDDGEAAWAWSRFSFFPLLYSTLRKHCLEHEHVYIYIYAWVPALLRQQGPLMCARTHFCLVDGYCSWRCRLQDTVRKFPQCLLQIHAVRKIHHRY